MAVAPRLQSLAGKWQIPLLAASVGLFVAGLLQLRPNIPKVTFEDYLRDARVALQAECYDQASEILTGILNQDMELTDPQRAAAHRMLAETIWEAESSKTSHNLENARRILSNFSVSQQLGDEVQEADYRKLAEAADWLGDHPQAIEAYEKSLHVKGADRPAILLRIVEILLSQAKRDWEQIDSHLDSLLTEAAGRPGVLLRGLQWKMQRLLSLDDIEAAKALVHNIESKLDVPPWSYHLQYFQAQILFREEQYEAAEGRLRALQANLRRGNPLYAQAGWLLGRINYIENRPETALSFFDEVVQTQADREYWLASLLGKAESLASLERYAGAAESYEQVIETISRSQGSMLLDEHAIRESLRTLATVLMQQGRPVEALPFVQTAERLVPQGQTDLSAMLIEMEAKIRVQAGEDYLQRAQEIQSAEALAPAETLLVTATMPAASQPGAATQAAASTQPAVNDLREKAREHLTRAGELYAQLAKYRVLEGNRAEDADWESARCFERAGGASRTIEAFELFITQHPNSQQRTPEAMYRLGKALNTSGKVGKAIATFEDLLGKFGRNPWATACIVPLARCHMNRGPKGFASAEQTLLSVVRPDPDKPGLLDPTAAEFHDALIELARLYMQWDKPERAIERLEQALSLYPDDPQVTGMEYELAGAYRTSGLGLLREAGKSMQPTQSDSMLHEANRRLDRARELYDRVASRLDVSTQPPGPMDRVYLKTSYVYRADCAFDIGHYSEAADLYGRVAWRWQTDPVALSAYVQIVRSYMAFGDLEAARSALARARWILRKIPDSQFNQAPDFRTRTYWTDLFDWVEKSGLING